MNESPRSQALPRRPIILRASALESGEAATTPEEAPKAPTSPALTTSGKFIPPPSTAMVDDPNPEVVRLTEKLEKYKSSLQQWTQAEVDWNSQRRLFEMMTENVSDLIVLTNREQTGSGATPLITASWSLMPGNCPAPTS